jgi:uncharacterized short protein YbdD (DUF466 family)
MWTEGAIGHLPSAIRGLTSTLRSLFGMPDYERYVQHQRAHHPGQPEMSEREFCESELKRKYEGGGGRCC